MQGKSEVILVDILSGGGGWMVGEQIVESDCSNRLFVFTVTMAFFWPKSKKLHIMTGICSLDNLYQARKPLC